MWASSGRLPAYRVGKSWIFLTTELEVWLASTANSHDVLPGTTINGISDPLGDLPELLKPAEVADFLEIAPQTLSRYFDRNEIPYFDSGPAKRISKSFPRAFLQMAKMAR